MRYNSLGRIPQKDNRSMSEDHLAANNVSALQIRNGSMTFKMKAPPKRKQLD